MNTLPSASIDPRLNYKRPCPHSRFPCLPAAAIECIDPRTSIVHPMLAKGDIGSIYGASGLGKSFLELELATSIALGIDWFGYKTFPCSIAIVSLEGRAGLRRRIRALEKHLRRAMPSEVKFILEGFSLANINDVEQLAHAVNKCCAPSLIIIDTLSRAAAGIDENSPDGMGKIIAGLSALRDLTGAAIVVIHHAGKDQFRGLRGHSSFGAMLDLIIRVERAGPHFRFVVEKVRDGESGMTHAFKLLPIDLGVDSQGMPVTSCVVSEIDTPVVEAVPKVPRGTNQQLIYSAFQELLTDQTSGIAYDEAMRQLADVLESVGPKHRRERTKEALDGLVKSGFLIIDNNYLRLPNPSG